jgi:hypothetical protein
MNLTSTQWVLMSLIYIYDLLGILQLLIHQNQLGSSNRQHTEH